MSQQDAPLSFDLSIANRQVRFSFRKRFDRESMDRVMQIANGVSPNEIDEFLVLLNDAEPVTATTEALDFGEALGRRLNTLVSRIAVVHGVNPSFSNPTFLLIDSKINQHIPDIAQFSGQDGAEEWLTRFRRA